MRLKFWKKKDKENKKKKSKLREWVDSIIFAVVAATIIRWLIMSAYTIPTPSMEGTQLVGDFLFVSKLHYGARTPKTLLHMPLTDNKIWGTNIPSYLSWLQLPIRRIPGFSDVKNNDVVVFNWPADTAGHPVDMKVNYIKRCIGVAGDKLEVKNTQVYINGKPAKNPEKLQFLYRLETKTPLNEEFLAKYEIYPNISINRAYDSYRGFELNTTPKNIEALKKQLRDLVTTAEMITQKKGETSFGIYPNSYWYGQNLKGKKKYKIDFIPWNHDYFGPLTIPKEGMKVKMTKENIIKYAPVIMEYEYNDKVDVAADFSKISIDGKEVKEYTFKQDYYFMMGDNRHNSQDSRYWGFVPRDHVVGKAWFTWLSLNPNKGLFSGKIRWGRMFRGIN
ncbi:S26 family signal peptidase [marine bacterium AO1-C]|nr:S26 family signal peptidase [marine bacterium AO1-C]